MYTGEVYIQNKAKNYLSKKPIQTLVAAWNGVTFEAPPNAPLFNENKTKLNCKEYYKQAISLFVSDKYVSKWSGTAQARIHINYDPSGALLPESSFGNNIYNFPIQVRVRDLHPFEQGGNFSLRWNGLSFVGNPVYKLFHFTGEPTIYYTPEAKYVPVNMAFLDKIGAAKGTGMGAMKFAYYTLEASGAPMNMPAQDGVEAAVLSTISQTATAAGGGPQKVASFAKVVDLDGNLPSFNFDYPVFMEKDYPNLPAASQGPGNTLVYQPMFYYLEITNDSASPPGTVMNRSNVLAIFPLPNGGE